MSVMNFGTNTPSAVTNSQPIPTTTSTPSAGPIVWGEYHINVPNSLILVDSQGRRTGKDPIAGTLYNEIPGTSYDEVATTPGHPVGELFTSNLPNGQYTLYVLGGRTGLYGLYAANNQESQTFQGNIQDGSMIAYLQSYNSSNLASSTFSLAGVSSSTASITSAPPQNLPSSAKSSITEEYDVSLPDALILVDSQGRRTGKDPITGTFYHEIPNTTYQEIGQSGELIISSIGDGQYTVYVMGDKTGNYWFDAGSVDQQLQSFHGTIQAGTMIVYLQKVDTSNLASTTVSFVGISSSTASITSAPPHNLPPPPVP